MTVALVPGTVNHTFTSAGATGGSLAFTGSVTAGNLLLFSSVGGASGTMNVPTDTLGNTWAVAASRVSTPTTYIWYTVSASSGTDTVSFTSGTSRKYGMAVAEFSGFASNAASDQSAGGGATSTTSISIGPTGTTTQANELAIGWAGFVFLSSTQTWGTEPTGFTNICVEDKNSTTQGGCSLDYQLLSATGTVSAGYALAGATNVNFGGVIATFMNESSGSTILPGRILVYQAVNRSTTY